jgi:hypothetical protein
MPRSLRGLRCRCRNGTKTGMTTRLRSPAEGCKCLTCRRKRPRKVADLVATTDGMIYHFYFGSTLPTGKMSIAQAVGHKPMTSAEYKNYESK